MCWMKHQRIKHLYENHKLYYALFGSLGIYVGINICEHFFFDEKQALKVREEMETEFWK